jgi:hypothetical protein
MNNVNFQNRHAHLAVAPLTNDQLRASAPSIFATEPWHAMSDKYAFIPTITVIEAMRANGLMPVSATQSRTRVPGKGDFTKHLIRFRDLRQGGQPLTKQVGQIYPEVVLINSHDGASAYSVAAGLYRLVCLNGLMVADSVIGSMKVPHRGNADGIIDASYEVIDQMPRAIESVESFQRLQLAPPEQAAFATAAIALRYDEGASPVTPAQVITPRRVQDRATDLWTSFNVVQENLVQGGLRGRNPETLRRARTRAVTGIAENTKLNKALWTLAEEMKKLKS